MSIRGCTADDLTARLVQHLRRDFGDAYEELARSARASRKAIDGSPASLVEDHDDGCLSYAEAVRGAAEIATRESLLTCSGNPQLLQTLWRDHGVRIPWLPVKHDDPATIDDARWATVLADIDRIRRGVEKGGFNSSTPEYKRELGRRLFHELMPFAQFRSSEIDPHEGVWRFYAVSVAAGLDASFVALPIDPLGRASPTHVALSINLGDGRTLIADPAYEAYDLKGLPAVQLDAAQAMSLAATHRALSEADPVPSIELAERLDPSNRSAQLLEIEARAGASAGLRDPLEIVRESAWLVFTQARARVDQIRSAPPASPIQTQGIAAIARR